MAILNKSFVIFCALLTTVYCTETTAKPSTQSAKKVIIKDLPLRYFSKGIRFRLTTGKNITVGFFTAKKGSPVARHHHRAEQITFVIRGELKLTVGKNKKVYYIHSGELIIIPSEIYHKAIAVKDSTWIDMDSPIRKSWINNPKKYYKIN